MTQITQAQMAHAWAVLLAAVLFVMMGVAFVQERQRSKFVAVLSLLPGAFCFFLWATAAVRYVLGVGNA